MLSLKYLVLALAAVAEAGKLYGCAGTCIGKAITATGCSSSNSQCICSSVMFMETIKDCAASDCTEAQTESALTVAEEFCNLIGNDLPQLTHEKRGERGHGRGGHRHGRPQWEGRPPWEGEGEGRPPWEGEGEGRPPWEGEGRPPWEWQGEGRPPWEGEGEGRPPWAGNGAPWGESNSAPAAPAAPEAPAWNEDFPDWSSEGPPGFEGGRPGFEGGRPGWGAPPPQYTQTPSVSTPAQPAQTQAPPPKHPQPPAPAHPHPGQPTTTAAPTWTTGPSAPEHTVW